MWPAWLGTTPLSPSAQPRGIHTLLVDVDMLIRSAAAAHPDTTVRGMAGDIGRRLGRAWQDTGATVLVAAFDAPSRFALARTARAPVGGQEDVPVDGSLFPSDPRDGRLQVDLDATPAWDAVLQHVALYAQLQRHVAHVLLKALRAPTSAGPDACALLVDTLHLGHAKEYVRARLEAAERVGAHAGGDVLACVATTLLCAHHRTGFILSYGPPHDAPWRSPTAVVPWSDEKYHSTGLGEAVIKLCAFARCQEHACFLWSDHPDALVPALLTPAVRVLCASSTSRLEYHDLAPLRPARTLFAGLVLAGCSPLLPAFAGVTPEVARAALSDLEEGRAPGRPAIQAEALAVLPPPGLTCVAHVDLVATVHLLAHAAHVRVGRLSPTLARSGCAWTEVALLRHTQELRRSTGMPREMAPDTPSVHDYLVRARRAQWLLSYYLATSPDDGTWFMRSLRAVPSDWGWRIVTLEDDDPQAQRLQSGVRFSLSTRAIESVSTIDRIRVPLEAEEALGRVFG